MRPKLSDGRVSELPWTTQYNGLAVVTCLFSILARVAALLLAVNLILTVGANAQSPNETLLVPDNAYNPNPSPDGKFIAYVRTGWGEGMVSSMGRASLVSDVKLLSMQGDLIPTTIAENYFISGWTPDSTRLVCYRDSKYAFVSTEGKKIEEGLIPDGPDIYYRAEWVGYSPSLATFVWSRRVDKTHRAIETPKETIVREAAYLEERVVPSPNGRYLAVFRDASETDLRIYDLRSKLWTDLGAARIHPDDSWTYIQPNWNPWFADGSRLVFLRDSTLVIASPDGTDKQEIKITGPAGLPAPSPDGQSIAYVTFEPRPKKIRPDLQFWGGTTIWMVSATPGSTPRPATEKNQDEVYDLKWLNDDTLVFDRIADVDWFKHARIWKAAVPR